MTTPVDRLATGAYCAAMTVAKLQPHQLPYWPRLLSQPLAAAYVGVSEGLFSIGVNSGLWPQPLTLHSRKVWDREALDRRIDAIGHAPLITDAETRKRRYQEKLATRALARQSMSDRYTKPIEE